MRLFGIFPWVSKRLVGRLAVVLACALLVLPARPTGAFVLINEIMYHPTKEGANVEFVELLNDSPTTREIDGWKFTDGIEYTFPAGTSIPAHGHIVVAAEPDTMWRVFTIPRVYGPYSGKLDNAGETLELRNETGGLIDRVDYKDEPPWPAGADGTGHSLSLVQALSENERAKSWILSNQMGGTPGRPNFPEPPRPPTVVINEIVCESARRTWIELFNPTTATVDLSGCLLSDEADDLAKFIIPTGTRIDPGQFVVFEENAMGFALQPKRRKLFLCAPQARHVIDATAYRETAAEDSIGRWPDGADAWYRMTQTTPDAPNTATLNTAVVINEIMYHPFSRRDEDEYVELYNRGRSPVDLTGWAFTNGIDFEFPSGTVLPADGYLIVAKDKAALTERYGIDNCVGNYDKRLSNDSDRLVLVDALGNVADEVRYHDGGRWPVWADGGGSSLELVDPRQDNAFAAAWAASDETAKAEWTRFEYSKAHGDGESEFHMFLLDDGVCLVDDVRLVRDGEDFIPDGTFDGDAARWRCDGTHKYSDRYTSDSYSGPACLRIVAVGRGTTGINRIVTRTSGTLETSATYTVSYWAKWQAGNHRLCTRTHGHGVAQTNALPVPKALGTPGRRNSRRVENTGPIIAEVRHRPVTPTSGTAVTVAARVLDADGVASATVFSRVDGHTTWTANALVDDGRHGEGSPADGIYSASLPVQPGDTLVEFYIQAHDRRGAARTFPADAPRRTALYRVAAAPRKTTRLKTFDLLLKQDTWNALVDRAVSVDRMDNEFLDATMIVNDARALYNVGVRFGGSPWLRPKRGKLAWLKRDVGDRPSYRVRFNEDEKVCGLTSVNFDGQNVDHSRLHERMFYWLLAKTGGVPYPRSEFVGMFQNGEFRGVYELVQRTNHRFIKDYFPDGDEGNLYRVNTHYEWQGKDFTHERAKFQYRGPDKEAYRFNFEKRSNEKADDFADVIELCRLFDASETDDSRFETAMEAALQLDEWARSLACQAVAGDWDGLGFVTNKNARIYRRSDTGRWVLIPWDKDLTWGRSALPVVPKLGPGMARLMSWPRFQRIYFSHIERLLAGPFTSEQVDPRLDALHAFLKEEGEEVKKPFIKGMKKFLDRRTEWLRENALPGTVDFAITTHGGDDFSTNAATVAIEGTAPLGVRTIEINGQAAAVEWVGVATWKVGAVRLNEGKNRLIATGRPAPDRDALSAAITITRD